MAVKWLWGKNVQLRVSKNTLLCMQETETASETTYASFLDAVPVYSKWPTAGGFKQEDIKTDTRIGTTR